MKMIMARNSWIMVMMVAFIALVVFADTSKPERKGTGIIWEIKPYYWIDKTKNQTMGIIADSFAMIKTGCLINQTQQENLEQTFMPKSLKEFREIFSEVNRYKYGQGPLKNITSESAIWLPVIQEFNRSIYGIRNMTEKTLFMEPKTSVIVHRQRISLFYKLKLGILQTRHILVLSFLSAIIFAILVWFAERWNNPEFGKSFTSGFGTGLWWAFVTMTTVGYGDVVPRSFVGRFLTIIWMILGLAAASLMTAAVSDVVLGVDYIDLSKYTVATINGSYEARAIVRDYNSKLVECNSYDEVVQAVSSMKADAGVLPSYVAGSMMLSMYYEYNLRVPFQLDLELPVKMLYNPELFQNEHAYVECVNTYFDIVFNMFIRKYKVFVQTETLYVESIPDFYKTSKLIKYFTISIGALIVGGLLYDLGYGFFLFSKKPEKTGRNSSIIIQNNKNFTELKDQNKNKLDNNSVWRNEELNKMKQDIMGIKENIMKINTLAKHKNPWY